jgi:acetyl-CoA carboxylase biotin carboxyl carrier protein
MPLTEDEVIQILKLIEESNFDELNLTMGDLKLVVRKRSGGSPVIEEHVIKTPTESPINENPVVEIREKETETPVQKIEDKTASVFEEGLITIKSPMLGTFYRRPDPTSPPYVEVGSFVEKGDTVCLIEIMKVFNAVKGGIRGYIAKIFPESGQLVEYGQPLFLVKANDNSSKREIKT